MPLLAKRKARMAAGAFVVASMILFLIAPRAAAQEVRYQPNWESLDQRPIPQWFDDAKFGIFIHWGLYSVPAWGPKGQYAEWYWRKLEQDREKNGPFWQFHVKTYGADFRYQDFAGAFRAEMFDPGKWADLFAEAGARYVVLTAKHHDGFCLWPSAESWNWNSLDVGPHRDLVGELTKAVRERGLRMGLYYSLYEWYHPHYRTDLKRYVDEHMLPQLKDLVTRYQPSVIFADGEWDHPSQEWRSEEFLAWLYNEAPNRDEVVVNDRWGKETRSRHGGYYTTEYGKVHEGQSLAAGRKWEENRGMGASFGYNRNEDLNDYRKAGDLVHLLVELVSRGGNLLLNVGPTADGRIPVIMQDRLVEIGRWLEINGEAIYGTRQWRVAGEGERIRYTRKGQDVYAISLGWPGRELVLSEPRPTRKTTVALLGYNAPLRWKRAGGRLRIGVPQLSPDESPVRYAYVFKLSNVE